MHLIEMRILKGQILTFRPRTVIYVETKDNQGKPAETKKGIIFNVHYRPGSKKSKFDMTLI